MLNHKPPFKQQRKKIFEKFQSQGFEVIHNVSTSILILRVIVIERAHSCHQICNILSSLLWCCFIIWPETPDGYNDCNHNNDWCAISQAHWHAWDGIHMYVLVMDRVPAKLSIRWLSIQLSIQLPSASQSDSLVSLNLTDSSLQSEFFRLIPPKYSVSVIPITSIHRWNILRIYTSF